MMAAERKTVHAGWSIGRPPVPHEHGAWVMLLAPIALGFGATRDSSIAHWLMLGAAAALLFCAREATGLIARKRASKSTACWLALYLVGGGGMLVPLAAANPRVFGILGLTGTLMFAGFNLLQALPARKRLDRTAAGEVAGAFALTMTGAAAVGIATHHLGWLSIAVWTASGAYFAGGVLYVKMWLGAAKRRADFNAAVRASLAWPTIMLHAALAAIAIVMATVHWPAGGLIMVAVAPAIARAFVGAAKLSPTLPPLKRVGIVETGLAVWYTAWMMAALRILFAGT